jgi:hypothetical protein
MDSEERLLRERELQISEHDLQLRLRDSKFEFYRLITSALIPISVVVLAGLLTRQSDKAIQAQTAQSNKQLEEYKETLQSKGQILQEKQHTYAELGKDLNTVYIYVADVGDFAKYPPEQVIDKKRDADRLFYMYRSYWSDTTERNYFEFMTAAFTTYGGGQGRPALINSYPQEKEAGFKFENRQWNSSWNEAFSSCRDPKILEKFNALIMSLLQDTVDSDVRKSLAAPPEFPQLRCDE